MRIVRVKYVNLDNKEFEMVVTSNMSRDLGCANDEEEMIISAIRFVRKNCTDHIFITSVEIIAD